MTDNFPPRRSRHQSGRPDESHPESGLGAQWDDETRFLSDSAGDSPSTAMPGSPSESHPESQPDTFPDSRGSAERDFEGRSQATSNETSGTHSPSDFHSVRPATPWAQTGSPSAARPSLGQQFEFSQWNTSASTRHRNVRHDDSHDDLFEESANEPRGFDAQTGSTNETRTGSSTPGLTQGDDAPRRAAPVSSESLENPESRPSGSSPTRGNAAGHHAGNGAESREGIVDRNDLATAAQRDVVQAQESANEPDQEPPARSGGSRIKAIWAAGKAPLSYAGFMGVAQVISLTFFALVSRAQGPVHISEFTSCYSLAAFISTVIDFGESTNAVRVLAEAEGKFDRTYLRYAGSRLALLTLLALLGLGIGFFIPFLGYSVALGSMMAAQVFFIAAVRINAGPLRLAMCFVVEKLTTMSIFFLAPRSSMHTYTPCLYICCGLLVSVIVCMPYWPVGQLFSRIRLSKSAWYGGQHMGIATIVSRVSQLDVIVVTATGHKAAAGAYSAVSRWSAPFNLYSQSVAQYMLPQYTAADSHQQAKRLLRQTNLLLLPAALVLVVVSLTSSFLVPILLGSQFNESGPALSVLCYGALAAMYASSYYTFVQARHLDKLAVPIYIGSVVLQFAVLVPAVFAFGAAGGSGAFLLGQVALMIGCRRLVNKSVPQGDSTIDRVMETATPEEPEAILD